MSIRTIEFSVNATSISPKGINAGGTQKEHNPIKVKFNLDATYLTALRGEATARSGTLYYRFDIYDGEGGIIRSDSSALGLTATYVEIPLTENITRYGGTVQIFVVFTVIETATEKTVFEDYTEPAMILLKNLPDSNGAGDDTELESFTTLAEVAKAAANRSESAAESAEDDKEATELYKTQTLEAKYSLEHGAEFLFFGGDATRRSTTDIVVDLSLNSTSENAIANKTVYQALQGKATPSDITTALTNLLASSNFQKAVFLANHQVNDLYVTLNSTNPGTIYTGTTWELVAQGRALVGVGTGTDKNSVTKTFGVGNDENGEYAHTLTINEMPSHKHKLHIDSNTSGSTSLIKVTASTEYGWVNGAVEEVGGNGDHNNIQPSYGVYVWKRLT